MFSPHDLRPDLSAKFRLTVPSGTKKEDILNPNSYRDIARNQPNASGYFRSGSIIEVVSTNNDLYGRFLIVGAAKDEIFLREIEFKTFGKIIKEEAKDFKISWDEKTKYVITRKSDNKIIRKGFSSEEEAEHYLKNIY